MVKSMKKGDDKVKQQITSIFKHSFLTSGNELSYEIKNREMTLISNTILKYFNSSGKGFTNDVNAHSLMRGLKNILDLKLSNKQLNLNTYL